MKDIYSYKNYRKLIKDYFLDQKKKLGKFSYRDFAKHIGFKTDSYLIEVIAAKKKLSLTSMLKIAKSMDLSFKQTQFFECLVKLNNAGSPLEKTYYSRCIKTFRK